MLIIYLYTANIQKEIKSANKISCKNKSNLFRYKKTSELHDIIMPSYFVAGGHFLLDTLLNHFFQQGKYFFLYILIVRTFVSSDNYL